MSAGYLAELEARIAGIPCRIGVTAWERWRPGRLYGPPEDCYPDEGGHGEWEVLDARGRPAPWLARKMTERDADRIEEKLFRYFEN